MQIEINLREHSTTDDNYLVTSTYLLILFSHYSVLLYLLNPSPLPHIYTEALISCFKKRRKKKTKCPAYTVCLPYFGFPEA